MTEHEFDDALTRARLEALAEFAAGAGHEINNPLATILGRTELLLRRVGRITPSGETVDACRDLNIIAGQVQRIRDMIGDLMLFARPPKPNFEVCDLSNAVRAGLRTISGLANTQGVELRERIAGVVIVPADRVQLAVVISELLRNSLNAMPRGGVIEASTLNADRENSAARLIVDDSGTGLSERDREHLFDPFYSGRQAGRGLGFGLCKCWRIVQAHGGSIHAGAGPGGGTRVVVEWPIGGAGDVTVAPPA